jgi:hypothetical protein
MRKYKDKEFLCEYKILTEGVFVTQLSSNAGIRLLFHERFLLTLLHKI